MAAVSGGEEDVLFVTIPTAGSHPFLVQNLVEDSQLPRQQFIIVRTHPQAQVPEGCIVLDDFASPNIQRWWKRGIDEATARGATAVAVLNDDLRIKAETLPTLCKELRSSGAVIATPSRPETRLGLHKGRLIPYSPVIWGCLWVIDAASTLRPDPRYVWWYGDNDLDIRARRDHGGIVSCDVMYEHLHPGEGTSKSPSLVKQ